MPKRSTLRDVAALAGVTAATVSYVLNDTKRISAETKKRVWEAIQQLEYVPDLAARGLSRKGSRMIGVVVPQTEPGGTLMFRNGFYGEIVESIEYHMRPHGYHVLISATNIDQQYLRLAKERNLEGIIVIGMYPDEFYTQMKRSQVPIVLIDSYCEDHYYHNVRNDDAYGGYLATRYLLECGHKKIAFFSGVLKESGVMQKRLSGHRQALEEYGLLFHADSVLEGDIGYESGVAMAHRMLDSGISATAVAAAADMLAIGVIKGLRDRGLCVPQDISVVGYDDLEVSAYLSPPLTTIRQEISRKGERAAELLLRSIREPDVCKQEELLPVRLIERESVRMLHNM